MHIGFLVIVDEANTGTGAALAIVADVVEMHNGHVRRSRAR